MYLIESIPTNMLQINIDIESICFHVNLRKRKWFISAVYNPQRNISPRFFNVLTACIENYLYHYHYHYDNLLIIGDFNVEEMEKNRQDFMLYFGLDNIVKEPTCFKNPNNSSCIDLILTNRKQYLHNTTVIETSISDFHKMVLTVSKS